MKEDQRRLGRACPERSEGIQQFRNRAYDPATGTWIQEDPMGVAGGVNLYRFNNGNPVSFGDPLGLCPDCIVDAIAVVVDIVDIAKNGFSAGSALGLAADIVGAMVPVIPSPGAIKLVTRGAAKPKPGVLGESGRFSNKVKDQARRESQDTCVFCGTRTTNKPGPTRSEIDHAIPKSRGGARTIDNAQNTCRTCNRSKGTRTTVEILEDPT